MTITYTNPKPMSLNENYHSKNFFVTNCCINQLSVDCSSQEIDFLNGDKWRNTQLTFTSSNSTIETLKKRCKICSKLRIKITKRRQWRVLVLLLLTLNIFHTFFWCFCSYFEQLIVSRVVYFCTTLISRSCKIVVFLTSVYFYSADEESPEISKKNLRDFEMRLFEKFSNFFDINILKTGDFRSKIITSTIMKGRS